MSQITILNKDHSVRVVKTLCTDSVAIGQEFEGSNYLISTFGDRMLTPSPRHMEKEKKTFTEKKAIKDAKSEWKVSILKKYAKESGSATEIAKKHYELNQKFN